MLLTNFLIISGSEGSEQIQQSLRYNVHKNLAECYDNSGELLLAEDHFFQVSMGVFILPVKADFLFPLFFNFEIDKWLYFIRVLNFLPKPYFFYDFCRTNLQNVAFIGVPDRPNRCLLVVFPGRGCRQTLPSPHVQGCS